MIVKVIIGGWVVSIF